MVATMSTCIPGTNNVGISMTEENIDAMYLVGFIGGDFPAANVELFSTTQGGSAEAVYVYPDASDAERNAAKEYAEKHQIPMVFGGMGTCAHCHAENVEVEEDLDTVLCAPCRRMLYTQISRSKEIGASIIKEDARFKENPQITKGIRCSKYDGDCSTGCLNKAVPQYCGKWDGAPSHQVVGNRPETFWIDLEAEGRPRLLPFPPKLSLVSDLREE